MIKKSGNRKDCFFYFINLVPLWIEQAKQLPENGRCRSRALEAGVFILKKNT